MVIFAAAARADLRAVAEWIGADNPDRAETFVAEVRRACESLARHPRRFPLVAGSSLEGLRKRSLRGYLIFYRVSDRGVEISRIVHSARDWAALLD
jgi:plasmid stabilization system protein ParE